MGPAEFAPAGLLAVVFALIEAIKYMSRRNSNGNGNNGNRDVMDKLVEQCSLIQRLLGMMKQGYERQTHILENLTRDREQTIRADERAREFRRRMEEHMGAMECVGRQGAKGNKGD